MHRIEIELEQRILLLDGGLGTMTQNYNLTEKDYRQSSLSAHPIELKGNTDILNLTKPEIIQDIHLQYLEAGADIICTNTFGANSITQSDYDTAELVYDINYKGALLAKQAVTEYKKTNVKQVKFIAGAIGPTTKLASISPDVNDPGFRSVNFDQLVNAYTEQANALLDGGVDIFLLETITDTLNAKAALLALMTLFEQIGKKYPIMISGTITDASGRILSGQTVEAFLISISHAPILSVGLNCALGAKELRPYIQILDKECPFYVSTHPNAGLPNEFGGYDQTPDEFASLIYDFAKNGWLNIVGGCCGTTPEHIKAASALIRNCQPRKKGTSISQTITDAKTNENVVEIINNWRIKKDEKKPTFNLRELMGIVSQIEDEKTFLTVKSKFDTQQKLYHPEQSMLLNAHIFGRYQYLKTENRLARI